MRKLRFKIGNYNIHEGGYHEIGGFGWHAPDFHLLTEDVLKYKPDVICFEEIEKNTVEAGGRDPLRVISECIEHYTGIKYHYAYTATRSGIYTQEELDEWGRMTHADTSWGRPVYAKAGDEWLIGLGILSRFPIVSTEAHTMTRKSEGAPRNCTLMEAILDIDGVSLPVFVSHNEQATILTQLQETGEVLKNHSVYILCGDFNWSNWQDFRDRFPSTLTMVNSEESPFVTTVDGHSIDNIIAPEEYVKFSNAQVIDTKHSDHFLLLSDAEVCIPS